jgi:large subunit ribosomal protein L18
MSMQSKIQKRTKRRALRVRQNIKNKSSLPRVSVFRSLKNISAQIINDAENTTIVSFSSAQLKKASGDKKAIARAVGIQLAERAKSEGITAAVFDKGSYLFHGRVKELAEGLREGGLKI